MKTRTFLLVSAMAGALAIGAVDAASAQGMQDRMGPCMMQGSTDQQTMGQGMMQGGAGSGMGALFGSRVTPLMNLSAEDVRGYLVSRLDRLNNKRLKIGELKSDDGTITADIVT